MGDKSLLLNCPPPVDTQALHFKLVKRINSYSYTGQPPPTYANVLAVANTLGVTFIGTYNGFLVARSSSLVDEKFAHKEVPTKSRPTHIAVNCDETLLAVGFGASSSSLTFVYDLSSLDKQVSIPLVKELRLSTTANVGICDLVWNPACPGLLSACLSDGSVQLAELKPNAVELNSLPPQAGARCMCWSPKGKQIVIGGEDGKLVQYKPDMTPAKVLPAPSLFGGNVAVINVLWVSNFQFAAYYRDRGKLDESPVLVIVNAVKKEPITFVTYDDITYSSNGFRCPQFYFMHIPTWNIILVGSANSIEVAVLHLTADGKTWEQWQVGDSSRAELPLTSTQEETYPLGMALDLSSQAPVPWPAGETVLPPMPRLLLTSHEGRLCVFDIVLFQNDAPNMCCAPSRVVPEGFFDLAGIKEEIPAESISQSPIRPATPPYQLTPVKASTPLTAAPSDTRIATTAFAADVPQSTPSKEVPSFFSSQPQSGKLSFATSPQLPSATAPAVVAKPSISLTPQSPQMGGSTPEPLRDVTSAPKQDESVTPAPEPHEENAEDDAVYEAAILDEVYTINQDLQALLKECSCQELNLGSEQQFSSSVRRLEALQDFQQQVEEATVSQAEEVSELKMEILELSAKAEDARLVASRRTSKLGIKLRRSEQLDPIAARSLKEALTHRTFIESQLRQIADHLDKQWEEYQMACRKDAKDQMETPLMEDICKTVELQRKLLYQKKMDLARIQKEIEVVKGWNTGHLSVRNRHSTFSRSTDLSLLSESLLGMNIKDGAIAVKDSESEHERQGSTGSDISADSLSRLLDRFEDSTVPVISRALSYSEREAHKQAVAARLKNASEKITKKKNAELLAKQAVDSEINKMLQTSSHTETKQEAACKISSTASSKLRNDEPCSFPTEQSNTISGNDTPQTSTTSFATVMATKSPSQISFASKSASIASQSVVTTSAPLLTASSSNFSLNTKQDAIGRSGSTLLTTSAVGSSTVFNFGSPFGSTLSKTSFAGAGGDAKQPFGSSLSIIPKSEVTSVSSTSIASKTPQAFSFSAHMGSTAVGSKGSFALATSEAVTTPLSSATPKPSNSTTAAVSSKLSVATMLSAFARDKKESDLPSTIHPATILPSSSTPLVSASVSESSSGIFGSAMTNAPKTLFGQPTFGGSVFGASPVTSATSIFSSTSTTSTGSFFGASGSLGGLGSSTGSIFGASGGLFGASKSDVPLVSKSEATTMSSADVPGAATSSSGVSPPKETVPAAPVLTTTTDYLGSESVPKQQPPNSGLFSSAPVLSTSSSTLGGQPATSTKLFAPPVVSTVSAGPPQSPTVFGQPSFSAVTTEALKSVPPASSASISQASSTGIFSPPTSSVTTDPEIRKSSTPETNAGASPAQASSTGLFSPATTAANQSTGLFSPAITMVTPSTSSFTPATVAAPINLSTLTAAVSSNPAPIQQEKVPSIIGQEPVGTNTVPSPFGAPAVNAATFGTTPSAFSSGSSGIFGNTATTSTGIFGTTAASPSGGGAFSTPISQSGSIFGAPFGQQAQTTSSSFSTPNKPSTGFGSDINQATNLFGQMLGSPSTPAESVNIFSQVTPTKSAFDTGGSIFGSASNSNFGSPSGNVFAQASPSVFGTATTSSNIFGQNPATTANSFFGQAVCSPFGSGSAAPNQSPFGSPAAASKSPFGGSPFDAKPVFGQNVFGQTTNSAPIFGGGTTGTSGGSVFGGNPSFSAPSGPFSGGSGSVSQSGFGGGTSFSKPGGFGGSPIFGGNSSSSFGSAPSFGGAPAFGSSSAFGSPQKVFGTSPPAANPPFGQPSSSGFESLANQNTLGFGNVAQMSGGQQFGSNFAPSSNTFGSTPPQQQPPSSFGGNSFSSWR